MTEFIVGFFFGFAAGTWGFWWFHDNGKAWLDKQKQQVKDKL